jgi:hypothetical protein
MITDTTVRAAITNLVEHRDRLITKYAQGHIMEFPFGTISTIQIEIEMLADLLPEEGEENDAPHE